jgi:hypothetical protein
MPRTLKLLPFVLPLAAPSVPPARRARTIPLANE